MTSLSLETELLSPTLRGTLISQEVERQILGTGGAISTQMCRLIDEVLNETHNLLGTQPDLPTRKPHAWTVLTENESPIWSVLALSSPPTFSTEQVTKLTFHLCTAYKAMSPNRATAWSLLPAAAQQYTDSQQANNWCQLLASSLIFHTLHVMLVKWGVLSAYVGINQDIRSKSTSILYKALENEPNLCLEPRRLALWTIWSTLGFLHNEECFTSEHAVVELSGSLRKLEKELINKTAHGREEVVHILNKYFEELSPSECEEVSKKLCGIIPINPIELASGIILVNNSKIRLFWLTSKNKNLLIACTFTEGVKLKACAVRVVK